MLARGAGTGLDPRDEDDQPFLEDVVRGKWQKEQTSRLGRFAAWMALPVLPVRLVSLFVSLAPLRYLVFWLLKRSPTSSGIGIQDPALVQLVSLSGSPITRIQQHFSALLAGNGSSAQLFFYICQPHDEQQESEVWLFRARLLTASADIYTRFERVLGHWPWRLARMVDVRMSATERLEEAMQFRIARKCCLDAGFSGTLHGMCGEDLLSGASADKWMCLLRGWSSACPVSTAPVETAHARNRRSSASEPGPQTSCRNSLEGADLSPVRLCWVVGGRWAVGECGLGRGGMQFGSFVWWAAVNGVPRCHDAVAHGDSVGAARHTATPLQVGITPRSISSASFRAKYVLQEALSIQRDLRSVAAADFDGARVAERAAGSGGRRRWLGGGALHWGAVTGMI